MTDSSKRRAAATYPFKTGEKLENRQSHVSVQYHRKEHRKGGSRFRPRQRLDALLVPNRVIMLPWKSARKSFKHDQRRRGAPNSGRFIHAPAGTLQQMKLS
jgi:hypothetical protein